MAVSRAIANNGLPLKIRTEYTENDYWERRHPDSDEMDCVAVRGWLVRINGKKYPRDNWGDDGPDWTYRYTSPKNLYGKCVAIKRALLDARMQVDKRQFNGFFSKLVNQE